MTFTARRRSRATAMAKKDISTTTPPAYEEAFARLEKLVGSLEGGDISLADMVEKFAEGHKLLKICQEHLRAAELKIEQLKLEDSDTTAFAPMDKESQS
jgi:exodeoxyribonuclease VII small subunit